MARRHFSSVRLLAAHLAVLGLLAHAFLLAFHVPGSGHVPAGRDAAAALLFAGGVPICSSQGGKTLTLDESGLGSPDAPADNNDTGRVPSCPVCTGLGVGSFAPPVVLAAIAAPIGSGDHDQVRVIAAASDLSVDVHRNRGPPHTAFG